MDVGKFKMIDFDDDDALPANFSLRPTLIICKILNFINSVIFLLLKAGLLDLRTPPENAGTLGVSYQTPILGVSMGYGGCRGILVDLTIYRFCRSLDSDECSE